MRWRTGEPESGDVVRVKVGSLYHYGIFVTPDEVIQFGLPPAPDRSASELTVLAAPIAAFSNGGEVEVGVPEDAERRLYRGRAETVAAARKRLGEGGYNIIHNNCEHFAYECAFGVRLPNQAELLREKIRGIPVVDVYVYAYPFPTETRAIYPPERQTELDGIRHAGAREQKFYVWKLLEYALYRTFGLKMSELEFVKSDGKWRCDKCEFSLSHSDGIVAVALSRKPVGVDAEAFEPKRFTQALIDKMTDGGEREELARLDEAERGAAACKLWTVKEAAFKAAGEKKFVPSRVNTTGVAHKTVTADVCGKRYVVTVVSPDADRAVFRTQGVALCGP